jgi:beta-phosphoglucomutase-like phosphatase (HAD superfamily)
MNGVIFDFDGVLADSEPLAWRAWAEVLDEYGVVIDEADIAACTGITSRDTHAYFAARAAIPPYGEVLQAVDTRLGVAFRTELKGFGDAIAAVRQLAMVGVPMAIASSSSRANLDTKLGALDLDRYFDVTVAGDEVANGKPAPDLYLAAVERLGVDVATSIAVEDTAIGADAAAAAGLRTVVVSRGSLPTGAHPVVSAVDADLLLLWLGRI